MIFYDAVQFYDMGFGPRMISVTPPECQISPSSSLRAKDRGKAPGVLTASGWTSLDVNNPKFRCHDYPTAKLWMDGWCSNVGFVAGDGYTIIDNDEGEAFSLLLRALFPRAPRRFVQDPKHTRDAFFMRVCDFVGDGAPVVNREMVFRNGVRAVKLSILARGKQAVIGGLHPGTRTPYCWDRELDPFDASIPSISEDEFAYKLIELEGTLSSRGWALTGSIPSLVPAPVSAPPVAIATTHKNSSGSTAFNEARILLAQIPNRDTPPNITRTPVDEWLDDYVNWVTVAYALIGHLGSLATTPEAQAVWLEWSDGRAQIHQSSIKVWLSALTQPNTRFGQLGLVKLVRSFVREEPDFPDIDPDDPILKTKTPNWDAMRGRWAYCAVKGFIDMKHRYVINRQAFADKHAHLAWDLKFECGYPGKGLKPPSVADIFLAQPDRVEVKDITYAPGDWAMIPTDDATLPVFNLWRPTGLTTRPVSAADIQPWFDHLLFVLGSPVERDRFLRWCAFVIRYPQRKPNWHYLVMSVQGLGKDTMTMPIKLAVGDGNWCEELIYSLASNFTYVVENKLLIVGETAQPKAGFISAHDVQTKLKPLLAAPPDRLPINKKNIHPYWIPNRLAVILFSNEENPLALERGQRRVHVVNRRAQKTKDQAYYVQLNEWLQQGGAELAASYLLNMTLTKAEQDEFIGGVAPASDDKAELEDLNVHPQLQALESLIEDARAGIKDGTPFNLIANAEELAQMIRDKGVHSPSPNRVSAWLLNMEREGNGVHRQRIDPSKPNACGVVFALGHSGRLWRLADKTADGRDWNHLTTTEIISIWKNLPAPSNASVTPLRSKAAGAFPDDEEPV